MEKKTYKQCCAEVAAKHKLGKSLVTGHRAGYWEEAAEMYAGQYSIEKSDIVVTNVEIEDPEVRNKWSTDDLLPCPFCDGRPEWVGIRHPDSRFRLKCFNCRFYLIDDRRDKVVSLWNSRSNTPGKETRQQYKIK